MSALHLDQLALVRTDHRTLRVANGHGWSSHDVVEVSEVYHAAVVRGYFDSLLPRCGATVDNFGDRSWTLLRRELVGSVLRACERCYR